MDKLTISGELNALAQALTAPRDINPIRFPSLRPQRTDVARLSLLTTVVVPNSADAATMNPIAGSALIGGELYVYLVRHPIVPCFTFVGPITTTVRWTTTGVDMGAGFNTFGVLTSPTTNTRWNLSLPPSASNVSLGWTYGDENGSGVFAPRGAVVTSGSAAFGFDEALNVIYHSKAKNSDFFFFGGGSLVVTFTTYQNNVLTNMPATCSVQPFLQLQRYVGEEDDLDEIFKNATGNGSGFDNVTIVTGSNSGTITYDTYYNGSGQVRLEVGFYRVRVFETFVISGGTALGGGWTLGMTVDNVINNQWILCPKVNTGYKEGSYIYTKARVNCHAMLMTNRTPTLVEGGEIYGAKMQPNGSFDNTLLSSIDQAAALSKTGYSGPAKNGMYTWMERGEADDNFVSYIATRNRDQYALQPFVLLDNIDVFHMAKVSTEATSTPYNSFVINISTHLEFISTNQLAKLYPAVLTIRDLEFANGTLVNAPLFTENWVHLKQLWGGIKKVGRQMLAAGGTAAAKVAMQELIAASAFL